MYNEYIGSFGFFVAFPLLVEKGLRNIRRDIVRAYYPNKLNDMTGTRALSEHCLRLTFTSSLRLSDNKIIFSFLKQHAFL